MYLKEGFPGQRLQVMPQPLVRVVLSRPVTSRLVVTDCGVFPRAIAHRRSRPQGSRQAIVILCTEGSGWCRVGGDDTIHPIGAGQVLVIEPGVPHEYGSNPDAPWTIWWMHVAGSDVPELLDAMRVSPTRPVLRVRDVYRSTALIDEALTRMETDESVPTLLAAAGAAWHLLAMLAADQVDSPQREDPIRQALAYLQERIGTRTSVAELASLAGLSPSHFAALFTQATGHGVLAYQNSLKMSRARDLLDTTGLAVSDVARAIGYTDALYFSRQFHKHHGASPTAYRKQAKG
ncbi:helix-turn-helix domain-containing protein [Plantibacter sp. Mn2098]|uniref:helix-turn-helix domain-containing protein n=1 Tax=Plantibacter sp. Mn2098 TaxID=3395266 RepID=UPI003BC6CBF9